MSSEASHPISNLPAPISGGNVAIAEMIPFPTGKHAIPAEDMAEFSAHPLKEQERIKFLLSLFAQMEAGGIVSTSNALAFKLRNIRGYGAGNLRTNYYKWREDGWKSLARCYTNGGERMPHEFVEYFRALCEQNSRSIKQAMNLLKRRWMSGESIPGYGTWREWFLGQWPERDLPTVCPGTPKGWKKTNLYELQPTKAQRALATKGFAGAKAHLPSMVRDTGSLLPLQLIAIDDFEVDQLCFYHDPVKGTRAICRMAGIAAMDVATRRIIGLILKPRLENDEGTKQSITRAEVRLLLYQVLRDYGVPAYGMTILAENAAAAITTELELTFKNLFGGRIAVTRTNMIADKVLANGFIERGGKPWLKGWIESAFNLMHNVAGFLPGQKGANYMVKPGYHEEALRVTERLIGTGKFDAQLSEEQVAQARLPFLSATKLAEAYNVIFEIMETRTEHAMRGFDKVVEWRSHASENWRPFADLATVSEREQLSAHIRERMQSPRERWASLWPRAQGQCNAVADHVLMMLLLTPKKAELKGHKLTFVHNAAGYTWIVDPKSKIAEQRQGTEVLCYFDPTRPDHAHICRLDGRALGEVRRLGPVNIADQAAVTEAEKQLAELYGAVLATVRNRPLHQETDAQLLADNEHNAQLATQAAQLRNTEGVTATLNRAVPEAGAETPAGAACAAHIAQAALTRDAGKTAAKALQRAASLDATQLFT